MSHISRKLNSIAWQWPYFLYIYIYWHCQPLCSDNTIISLFCLSLSSSHNIFLLLLHESALQTSSFNCVKVYIIFASSDVRLPSGSRSGFFFECQFPTVTAAGPTDRRQNTSRGHYAHVIYWVVRAYTTHSSQSFSQSVRPMRTWVRYAHKRAAI